METLPRPDTILRDEQNTTTTKPDMAIAFEDYTRRTRLARSALTKKRSTKLSTYTMKNVIVERRCRR